MNLPTADHPTVYDSWTAWGRWESLTTIDVFDDLKFDIITDISFVLKDCTCNYIPPHLHMFHKVYVQDSISHRADSHSSRHHWQWSTSCKELPQGLSTSLAPFHRERHNTSHPPNLSTCQNRQLCKCSFWIREYSWQLSLCVQSLLKRDTAYPG